MSRHDIDELVDDLDENQLSDRLDCCSRRNIDMPPPSTSTMLLDFS
jgi:hypothetical protein